MLALCQGNFQPTVLRNSLYLSHVPVQWFYWYDLLVSEANLRLIPEIPTCINVNILVHNDEYCIWIFFHLNIWTEPLSYHFTEQIIKLSPLLINFLSSLLILLAFAGIFITQHFWYVHFHYMVMCIIGKRLQSKTVLR